MKKKLLLLFFYFNCISAFSQDIVTSDIAKNDTIIFIKELDCTYNNKVISCDFNKEIYFLNSKFEISSDSIKLYKYSTKNHTYTSNKFSVAKFHKDTRSLIGSICINKDFLAILYGNIIYIYKNKDDNFEYYSFFISDFPIKKISITESNKIIIFENYYNEKKSNKGNSIRMLDIKKNKIQDYKDLIFLASKFSYFSPDNFFEITPKSILLSQISDYNIREYTFGLDSITSFGKRHSDWIYISNDYIDSITKECKFPIQNIQALSKINDDSASLIRFVYFSNDHLYVFYNYQGMNKGYFDIWKHKNGKWQILKEKILDYNRSIPSKISIFPYCRPFHLIDDVVYRFIRTVPIIKGNMSNEEYNKLYEEYLINNPYVFAIETIKIIL